MRTTNAQITAVMASSMNDSTVKLAKLMQQMATNKRIQLPSDDPIASVRLLRIQREEAALSQYSTNISNLSSSLAIQETNLMAASDTILNINDLLLWAANGANTPDDLAAIAGELETLEQTLVNFVNVRDEEGRYLFSGTLSETPAITFDPLTQTYAITGNDKQRQAAVANGIFVPENVTAPAIFNNSVDALNQLHQVVNELKSPNLANNSAQVRTLLENTLNSITQAQNGILSAVTELGGRQNTLSLLQETNSQVSLTNQKIDNDLTKLDYAKASIDLANYQLALQASQKTYMMINNLSLFSQS
ncbi:MAG: flagellar hook-associated protein FlgL [Cellvibrio sp.]